jgi:hypothetical protein
MPDREKVIKAELDEIMDTARAFNYVSFSVILEHCVKILNLLKEQEAVVRCKDCKHYRATPGYCAYDRIWQENKGHVWGMYCKPDWFCADGKHK